MTRRWDQLEDPDPSELYPMPSPHECDGDCPLCVASWAAYEQACRLQGIEP